MKTQTAFLLLTFLVQSVFANSDTSNDAIYAEFANIINRVQLEKRTAYSLSKTAVADECAVFMDKDYFKGTLGKAIEKQMTQDPASYGYMLHGGTLNKYCRKYPEMTAKQKATVWVLIMTVIAHFESTCSPKAKAKGPNGTAYGYFQLHKGKEEFYDNSRNSCIRNASVDPVESTRCALGMIENQMQKSGGDLFSKSSYWDVLRPRGQARKADDIGKAIMKLNLCNPVQI